MTLLKWLTFLLESQTAMVLLFLILTSYASICSTMAFPPWENSNHVVVSVSIDFPSNCQQDTPFHCIAHDYPHADWDGLRDHSRDVPWEDICKLGVSAVLVFLIEMMWRLHTVRNTGRLKISPLMPFETFVTLILCNKPICYFYQYFIL